MYYDQNTCINSIQGSCSEKLRTWGQRGEALKESRRFGGVAQAPQCCVPKETFDDLSKCLKIFKTRYDAIDGHPGSDWVRVVEAKLNNSF